MAASKAWANWMWLASILLIERLTCEVTTHLDGPLIKDAESTVTELAAKHSTKSEKVNMTQVILMPSRHMTLEPSR